MEHSKSFVNRHLVKSFEISGHNKQVINKSTNDCIWQIREKFIFPKHFFLKQEGNYIITIIKVTTPESTIILVNKVRSRSLKKCTEIFPKIHSKKHAL